MPTFPRLRPTAGTSTCSALIALGVLVPAAVAAAPSASAAPSGAKVDPGAGIAATPDAAAMSRSGAFRGTKTAYVVFSRRTMTRGFARSVRSWIRANRQVKFVAVGYGSTVRSARAQARSGRWGKAFVLGDARGRITRSMRVRSVPALVTVDRRGRANYVKFPTARRKSVGLRARPGAKPVFPALPTKRKAKPRHRKPKPVAPAPVVPTPAPNPGKLLYKLSYGNETQVVDGRPAIKATYDAGSSGGGAGLGVWGTFSPTKTARLRYGVKFDPGFQWGSATQKLPGLGGGASPTGGDARDDGWSARIQVDGEGGSGRVTAYLYVVSQPSGAENTGQYGAIVRGADVRVQPGWNDIEYYVALNSPGQANGIVEIKVNGQLAVRHTGVRFHDSVTAADDVLGESFFGGVGTSPQTQNAYFTEMEVYDS